MNKLLTLSITLLTVFTLRANCQKLILKGDTLLFNSDAPLKQYPGFEKLAPKLKALMPADDFRCFDCLPATYNAEWTVINNELYLTNIYSSGYIPSPRRKADMYNLFPTTDGKVKADWVNADLWLTKGKVIGLQDIMTALYESEVHIIIIKGKLRLIVNFDYPGAGESVYARSPDSLKKFIYSNIKWSKIPDLKNKTKRVFITFQSGLSGMAENISITRSIPNEPIYTEEAIRVISLLPWKTYYKHGEVYKESWTMPVVFSEENRKKYAH